MFIRNREAVERHTEKDRIGKKCATMLIFFLLSIYYNLKYNHVKGRRDIQPSTAEYISKTSEYLPPPSLEFYYYIFT